MKNTMIRISLLLSLDLWFQSLAAGAAAGAGAPLTVDTPNLRQEFGRIAKRAGLSDLPKPFVNLRGSCETELTAKFPAHVTAAWLGHTPKIAEAHYLMVTAEHFERAIQPPADTKGAAQKVAHGIKKGF